MCLEIDALMPSFCIQGPCCCRLINPDYVRGIGLKPVETFNILKGKANRHIDIDNNGPLDAEKPISQISAKNPLEGVELRLRGGRGPGDKELGQAASGEQTAAARGVAAFRDDR